VLMNILHGGAPGVDIGCCPVVGVEQAMVQLLEPAREDRMRRGSSSREGGRRCSSMLPTE
jgi:hypothetical protein